MTLKQRQPKDIYIRRNRCLAAILYCTEGKELRFFYHHKIPPTIGVGNPYAILLTLSVSLTPTYIKRKYTEAFLFLHHAPGSGACNALIIK